MTEFATDAWRTVGRGDAIPNDFVVPFYLNDLKLRISIARVDDRFYAFGDLCTCSHEACPLSGGLLTGTTIMCQCHGSQFDVTTGAVISGPATVALNAYDVRAVQGSIQIRARPASTSVDRSFIAQAATQISVVGRVEPDGEENRAALRGQA